MKPAIAYLVVLAVGALFSEIDIQFADFTSGKDLAVIAGSLVGSWKSGLIYCGTLYPGIDLRGPEWPSRES